jgi:transcriptional regulator of NAD metabolism
MKMDSVKMEVRGNSTMQNKRKATIKKQLLENHAPIKATELAQQFNVSRQTIVGDIALLRAQGEPIIATARGYEYEQRQAFEAIIVCRHFPDQAQRELEMIVEANATIKDVIVEHPIYGQLVGQLRIRNQNDVNQFIEHVQASQGKLLSELTDGIHSHTITADSQADLNQVKKRLREAGILYQEG